MIPDMNVVNFMQTNNTTFRVVKILRADFSFPLLIYYNEFVAAHLLTLRETWAGKYKRGNSGREKGNFISQCPGATEFYIIGMYSNGKYIKLHVKNLGFKSKWK
jgi:hypothetical protein